MLNGRLRLWHFVGGSIYTATGLPSSILTSRSPYLAFIDQCEKALSGVVSSGQTDSGVSARMFGTFLQWLSPSQSTGAAAEAAEAGKGVGGQHAGESPHASERCVAVLTSVD